MASSSNVDDKNVPNLIYYQKPCIGNERGSRTAPPVQLIFPEGGFSLGIPVKESINTATITPQERDNTFAVLASGPERSDTDLKQIYGLQLTFLVLAIFNIVISSALYFNAPIVDTSKVSPSLSPSIGFNVGAELIVEWRALTICIQLVRNNRREIENVDYAFTMIIIIMGSLAVIFETALGISAYCLAILLNFLLGTSSLPYFTYSVRYIFDMFMLYIALVLRTRLMYTFLPLELHPTPTPNRPA